MTEQNLLDMYPFCVFHSGTVLACLSVSVNSTGGTEEQEIPLTGTQCDTADVTSEGGVHGYGIRTIRDRKSVTYRLL